ncbi:hypothetical protein J437_LFUL013252 [Ladona fulva]|uniref:G-protein coupled receptors family 1 profile domain-containing protein n=1 Tax=Ladona fulva TaxID=123851 RepID=A0A8K0P886_LADFU|nr:hypothetical protein J437_LFUL013252 [Ladona fulva]
MENVDLPGKIYVTLLLVINGLALILISACYGNIYYVIRKNSQERQNREGASNSQQPEQGSPKLGGRTNVTSHTSSDATVAKRMALLVFTDFACKAPIAFFGLTAMGGMPLIDVTQAKILLVFFYPLNSCANPFLYALLTKQYRRDLFTLLSRHGFFARKAARYKGAFPGGENDIIKDRVETDEGKDKQTTIGCWRNCSGPNGVNSRIGCGVGANGGLASERSDRTRFTSQLSYQRGSLLTQASSLEAAKMAPKIDREEAAIEMGELEGRRGNGSDSEEISLDQTHSEGFANEQKSVWSSSGSPHPIRNSCARLALSDEQERDLRRALAEASESPVEVPPKALEVTSHI